MAEHWPKRYEKALRYRKEEAAKQCIGAGILLEAAGFTETEYATAEHGKPYFAGGPEISLTHSGVWVMLGVSNGPAIGVDLEAEREFDIRTMARIMTAEEASYVGADPVRFFKVFTAKESVMKALGTGFATPPEHVPVYGSFFGLPVEAENKRFFVKTFRYEDAVVSVASEAEIGEILFHKVR